MNESALVVIPTTGKPILANAIASAVNQTYTNTEVWAVVDGKQYEQQSVEILKDFPTVKPLVLPNNTGKSKHGDFYGHRIYAAVSYLFDHDFILYLDQDNEFCADHVESMVNTCKVKNYDWCHSLRKIFNADGTYVCDDDCESLGKWPIYLNNNNHLVDTSSYCIKRDLVLRLAPAWYSGWGGDRVFYKAISQHFPNFGCTGKSTLCYRLDGNANSVNADFFIKGNEQMKTRYPKGFPWRI